MPVRVNVKQYLSLTARPWSVGLVELSMPTYGLASILVNRLTRSHENPIEWNDLKFQMVASYLARSLRFWSILPKTCSTMIRLAPRGSGGGAGACCTASPCSVRLCLTIYDRQQPASHACVSTRFCIITLIGQKHLIVCERPQLRACVGQ